MQSLGRELEIIRVSVRIFYSPRASEDLAPDSQQDVGRFSRDRDVIAAGRDPSRRATPEAQPRASRSESEGHALNSLIFLPAGTGLFHEFNEPPAGLEGKSPVEILEARRAAYKEKIIDVAGENFPLDTIRASL